jgi:uncharacterized protein (TIGR02246 family)
MSVEKRLARMETAEDVRRLVAAYATACDAYDVDAVSRLLHPDIVLLVGDRSWRGRDEVARFFRQAWAGTVAPQRHFITNLAIDDLQPDGAEATSYFLHTTTPGECPLIGWGSYRDTFARHDGALFFVHKEITMEFQATR